jgi:curved DNA-binding protein CbpA
MFIDYYAILDINERATQKEIKLAFKQQALKWHPDRNPRLDNTKRMQEINEAFLILKDIEARARYDVEYQRFKEFKKGNIDSKEGYQKHENHYHRSEKKQSEQRYSYNEYQSRDEILNKWMSNAKKQAIYLAKQTIEDFKGMVSVGVKAAAKEAGNQFVIQIIVSIIFIIIFAFSKSCNS